MVDAVSRFSPLEWEFTDMAGKRLGGGNRIRDSNRNSCLLWILVGTCRNIYRYVYIYRLVQ